MAVILKRIYAASRAVAAHLRHPAVPTALSFEKGAMWPADQFTARRLQDGSITDKKHSEAVVPPRVRVRNPRRSTK